MDTTTVEWDVASTKEKNNSNENRTDNDNGDLSVDTVSNVILY
jgi:hypothetical protein